jgi:hypothetical protein
MVPFGRLLDALSEVPDPRRAEGKRYPLAPLLLFTVLALLSGATSYRHIICFLEQRLIVLNALFGCTLKRAPSLNTLRTVLQTPWKRLFANTPGTCCRRRNWVGCRSWRSTARP